MRSSALDAPYSDSAKGFNLLSSFTGE